ncbi:conserved hypothetical protein [Gammaproteobacteria bacterium]
MTENSIVTGLYNALSAEQLPTRNIEALVGHFQHDRFFDLAVTQEGRKRKLKAHFSQGFNGRVFMTRRTLGRVEMPIPGLDIHYIEENALSSLSGDPVLRGAIVLVNNNDVIQNNSLDSYLDFFHRAEETIIAVWDFDNHHWYPMSTFLAAHSDIYFPTHPDYFSLLSRYNRTIAGPISAGVSQWSQSYLRENFDNIVLTTRSDNPLGTHIFYEKFRFRNQVVSTLGAQNPSVGFVTAGFHQMSAADRLRFWYTHKAHWIVPTLNDIPTRIFDALATGGIPIVPNTLKYHPEIDALAEHLVFFEASDLPSPQQVVAAANKKFDDGGVGKIIERHRLGTERHHASIRVAKMLKIVMREFGIDALHIIPPPDAIRPSED